MRLQQLKVGTNEDTAGIWPRGIRVGIYMKIIEERNTSRKELQGRKKSRVRGLSSPWEVRRRLTGEKEAENKRGRF